MTLRQIAMGLSWTAGAGALGLGWALLEPHLPWLRRETLPVLPRGSAPMRLLHISDIHLVPGQERKRRWVGELAELRPDLVINTGDNLGALGSEDPLLETLEPLLAFPGAFVLGSNDFYAPRVKNPARYLVGTSRDIAHGPRLDTRHLVDGLVSGGWLQLDNVRADLELGDRRVQLAGLADPHIHLDRWAEPAWYPDDLRLGVVHAPYSRVLDSFARADADLVLAGHTHGGQLRIPGWGAPVTNCDLPRDRARGTFDHAGTTVHVSAGIGSAPKAPVRFACRPEASLLTLTSR